MTSYDNWVEYADGRQEKLKLPVEYETDSILSIVKKRDGSVMVSLVGVLEPITDFFEMYSGVYLTNGLPCQIRATVTKYQSGEGRAEITFTLSDLGGTCTINTKAKNLPLNTPVVLESNTIISNNPTTTVVDVVIQKGCYVQIDNVQVSEDNGETWLNIVDGDFSNGEFKSDVYVGWVKVEEMGFSAEMVDGQCRSIDYEA